MIRPSLITISLACLMMAGTGMWLMFPEIEEIGGEAGVSGIPYVALIFAGSIAGALIAILRNHIGKGLNRYILNLGIGFLIWGVIGAVAGLINGEGPYLHRPLEGRIIGLWFSALYLIICILPGLLGSFSALSGSRTSMAAAVALMMSMSVIAMIYSEARYNRLLDQGIFPSLMTIVGLILYVEGLGMIRREEEFKDGLMGRGIIYRNLAFLAAFLTISSVIAVLPFIFNTRMLGIYEFETIFGKAVFGLILLVPLSILAIARRRS